MRNEDVEVIIRGDKPTVHLDKNYDEDYGPSGWAITVNDKDGEPLGSIAMLEIAKEIAAKLGGRVIVS